MCHQSDFVLCVSNPCFELWLLLHEKDVSKFSIAENGKILKNEKISVKKRYLDDMLSKIWGGYNKNKDFSFIIEKVDTAVRNAKKLDLNPEYRWPNDLGSRVYLIVERIK